MISGIMATAAIVSYDTVKQARAQAVISQFQKYRTAINDFYKFYGYLPGDLPDAQYRFSAKDYITSDFTTIKRWFETFYANSKMIIPFKGLLIIGY